MPANLVLKAAGLYTSPNQLDLPPGSLTTASNVIIKRDGVIESRRGYPLYGTPIGGITDVSKQLLTYQNRILRHYNTTLEYDSDGTGTFLPFNTTLTEVEAGLRIKGAEANQNLYITSAEGIKKLSASSTLELQQDGSNAGFIRPAGGIKALDVTASLNIILGNQTGFFLEDSAVGYRVLWNTKDINTNLIQGTPSQFIEIFNPMLSLMLQDYNRLLGVLDNTALVQQQAGVGLLGTADYVSDSISGALPITASADDLRTSLLALGTKLDTRMLFIGAGKARQTVSTQILTNSTIQIIFSADITSYLVLGDKLTFTGLTEVVGNPNTLNNNILTAGTFVSNTTVIFTSTRTDLTAGGIIANVLGIGTRLKYSNPSLTSEVLVPSINATNEQLVSIQTYLSEIEVLLQDELVIFIPTQTYLVPLDITTTTNVNLSIIIPTNATTNDFYQVYRTAQSTATGTTSLSDISTLLDEEQLVIEGYPTTAQISAGVINLLDNVPDSFKGANLYTNAFSGEGILQANDIPPVAKDINTYKNVLFYANTRTRQRMSLTLLGVSNIITDYNASNKPALEIANSNGTHNTYLFTLGKSEVITVTVTSLVAINGKYFTLNSAENTTGYYVWFYDVVAASAVDPGGTGTNTTGIRVDYNSGTDTTTTLATKIRNVLNVVNIDFIATASTTITTITTTGVGYTTAPTVGTAGSNLSVAVPIVGQGQRASTKEILLSNRTSPSIAIDQTARSIVNVINQNASEIVYGFYIFNPSAPPGVMQFESRDSGTFAFSILGSDKNVGSSFNPDISPLYTSGGVQVTITAISATNPTNITTSSPHGLINGDSVMIINSTSTPSIDGIYSITINPSFPTTQFTIPVIVSGSGIAEGFIKVSNAQTSTNEVKQNRIYYSKFQQPEAVPITNYFDVGSGLKAIIRIMPLRDSLFVFKEDGIFRISGESAPFSLSLFDSSAIVNAPDSVAISNNFIYSWTTQGISITTESGTSIISKPIDVDIKTLASSTYPHFKTATWGMGYESDNAYYVGTVLQPSDTTATIIYRYSNLTSTWTTFDLTSTCGIVNFFNDVAYIGAGNTNYLTKERKAFTRYDYSDREITTSLSTSSYFNNGLQIQLSNITQLAIGDVVVQNQTVTPFYYNSLLEKLDNDSGSGATNYFSTLQSVGGDDMRSKLVALATKLDLTSSGYFAAIASLSGTITNMSIANPTIITTSAPHGLLTGRLINISGNTTSNPLVNGNYNVIKLSSTTFSIPVNLTLTAGTNGTFITQDEDFNDLLACFNIIVSKLNNDPIFTFRNYIPITIITSEESIIMGIDPITKQITLNIALQYIVGPLIIYKAITSDIVYAPATFNDPINFKHIREAQILFNAKAFTNASMNFSTDLLPQFIPVPFNGDGNGIFGSQTFGSNFFGGGSHAAPFRTYVPRQCQRCTFIRIQFTHSVAREFYSIFGVTLTGEIGLSSRAYR